MLLKQPLAVRVRKIHQVLCLSVSSSIHHADGYPYALAFATRFVLLPAHTKCDHTGMSIWPIPEACCTQPSMKIQVSIYLLADCNRVFCLSSSIAFAQECLFSCLCMRFANRKKSKNKQKVAGIDHMRVFGTSNICLQKSLIV